MKKVFLIVPFLLFSGSSFCTKTDIEQVLVQEVPHHEFGRDDELLEIWNKKIGTDQDGLWYVNEDGKRERVTPENVRTVTPNGLTRCALKNARMARGKGFKSLARAISSVEVMRASQQDA